MDGEKLWGWGMGSQRQQWVISREQQTTGHVHRQASPNPPGKADIGGEGRTWDREQQDTLLFALLVVLISDPTEEGRGQWKPNLYSAF